jgi:hypothetical protein
MTTLGDMRSELDESQRRCDVSGARMEIKYQAYRSKMVDRYGEERVKELEKEALSNAKY